MELTELRDSDSEALFGWINDRELVEQSAAFRPVPRAEHDAWFAGIRSDPAVAVYAIREDGALAGTCQLLRDGDEAELRIRIGVPAARDRGLGTRAVGELVRIGFAELGLRRIWLQVFRSNARAIRAYEKSGFRVARTGATEVIMERTRYQGDGSSVPSSSSV